RSPHKGRGRWCRRSCLDPSGKVSRSRPGHYKTSTGHASRRRHGGIRVLVRVREHLFLPGGNAHRPLGGQGGSGGALAAVSARSDLSDAWLERLTVQYFRREGPLYVARPRARAPSRGSAAEAAAGEVSAKRAQGGANRARG